MIELAQGRGLRERLAAVGSSIVDNCNPRVIVQKLLEFMELDESRPGMLEVAEREVLTNSTTSGSKRNTTK
jgi:hypothetical protein